MLTENQIKVLEIIYQNLKQYNIVWAITGSAGFVLHGLDINVNDIDIQTDAEGAYEIEKIFEKNIIEPVRFLKSGNMRSHIGKLIIENIEIEVMGAVEKKGVDGIWGQPVDIINNSVLVFFKNMKLPVLTLEYEEQAYREMGRIKKADMLRNWINNHFV